MLYLFDRLDQIINKLADKKLLVFLDYDGTLVPIAPTPAMARMPRETKKLLLALEKNKQCRVAIISGRPLKEIKKLVGIKGLIYAGNHGMEIEGDGMGLCVELPASYKKKLEQLKGKLLQSLSRTKGVLIEDKGSTLSLHYRLANRAGAMAAKKIIKQLASPLVASGQVNLLCGKKVFELRPPINWDKGKAVEWILKNIRRNQWKGYAILPLYIGDDTTDEDAFRALKGKGLTVFVGGPKKSQAAYSLKGVADVIRFLTTLMFNLPLFLYLFVYRGA